MITRKRARMLSGFNERYYVCPSYMKFWPCRPSKYTGVQRSQCQLDVCRAALLLGFCGRASHEPPSHQFQWISPHQPDQEKQVAGKSIQSFTFISHSHGFFPAQELGQCFTQRVELGKPVPRCLEEGIGDAGKASSPARRELGPEQGLSQSRMVGFRRCTMYRFPARVNAEWSKLE